MDRDQLPKGLGAETEATRPEGPTTDGAPSSMAWSAMVQRKIQRRALARRAEPGAGEPAGGESTAQAVEAADRSAGQPVDAGIRARVEGATGADLGGVRVHTGSESQTAADALSAKAYTVGQDVHFNAGQYQPGTAEGDRLIAHELVHTVQQGAGGGGAPATKLEVSEPGDAAEVEADRIADAIVDGGAAGATARPVATPTATAQRMIMRDKDDDKSGGDKSGGDKGAKGDKASGEKTPEKTPDKGAEAKPVEAPAAEQGPSEIVLSDDASSVNPGNAKWYSDQLAARFVAWGVDGYDASAVRVATLKRGDAEVKAIVLTWKPAWGKQPSIRSLGASWNPFEASLAVTGAKKLKGWGKVDAGAQGTLEALLGGESNDLSAAARGHLKPQMVELAKKGEDDQAKALSGTLGAKDAVPDVVAENVETTATKYTLDGPTVQKKYSFAGRTGDAELWVAKYADGTQLTIVSPKAMEKGYHNHSVKEAADAAAHMPKNARLSVTTIMLNPVVNPDDAHWAVEYNTPDFHSYMTAGAAGVVTIYPNKKADAMPSASYMQGTMIHESGHAWSYQNWGNDTKAGKWVEWQKCMDADKVSVSGYAKNSIAEDVAESIQVYGSTMGTPKHDEYRSIIPKRFAMLDEEYTKKVGKGPPKASDSDSKDSKNKGGSWT